MTCSHKPMVDVSVQISDVKVLMVRVSAETDSTGVDIICFGDTDPSYNSGMCFCMTIHGSDVEADAAAPNTLIVLVLYLCNNPKVFKLRSEVTVKSRYTQKTAIGLARWRFSFFGVQETAFVTPG